MTPLTPLTPLTPVRRWGARAAALALAIGLAAGTGPARAAEREVEGVAFAQRLTARGQVFALNDAALLRYRVFVRAYVAALYLAPDAPPERVLEDVPKRLEIEYFWAIDAEDFARAGDEVVARNVDEATYRRLQPRLERLNALYRDVEPGDRYALTYVPGRGTELSLNGEPLGVVEGADLAAAVFSIWLGPDPLSEDLKAELLSAG